MYFTDFRISSSSNEVTNFTATKLYKPKGKKKKKKTNNNHIGNISIYKINNIKVFE